MTRVVLCAEGAVEPTVGIERYFRRWPATAVDPVRLLFGVRRTGIPDSVVDDPHVSVSSFLPGRGLGDVTDVAYERWSTREICARLVDGDLSLDCVVVPASSPDWAGRRHLGGIDGYLQLAVDRAHRVVIEEHPNLPVVIGAAVTSRADEFVRVPPALDAPFTALSGRPDPVSGAIAGHVAGLVPERPHLALGVGRVADALVNLLVSRRGLALVTGALTESARRLDAAGALAHEAPMYAMSVIGNHDLLAWAAKHPRVRLLPSTTVHDPAWLGEHERMTVVLGALSVDPEGNVNSETADSRLVSGLGGAPDLAMGAALSSGGRCIVALPSRTRDGDSTLCEAVDRVSVDGTLVSAVVTERGAVCRPECGSGWDRPIEEIF